MNYAARIAKGIAAVVVLALLIVGVPWALWHFIGWPLPHGVPSWSEARRTLEENGIPDEVLLKALAVVVWLTWALLVASIVAESAAAIRGRTATHLPLAGPFQAFAGVLVSAVILAALTTLTRPVPTRTPSLVASLQRGDPVTSTARLVDVAIPSARASPDGNGAIGGATPTVTAQVPVVYEVVPGDTLWDIAQSHLGDPFRWPEIYNLNKGSPQPDGRALSDPHWIYPGWRFELPSAAAVSAPPAVVPPKPPAPEPPPPPATRSFDDRTDHHVATIDERDGAELDRAAGNAQEPNERVNFEASSTRRRSCRARCRRRADRCRFRDGVECPPPTTAQAPETRPRGSSTVARARPDGDHRACACRRRAGCLARRRTSHLVRAYSHRR